MASSSAQLGDIEKRFFGCSFCLQTLKEPKTLPCSHRYCRECLKKIISEKKDAFNCPLCDEKCDVPPEGLDGFKTDSLIKNVLEFCQLKNMYEENNIKRCCGYKEVTNVICYCFKCRDFLCRQCYQFHLDNDMVEQHRPHLLDLQTKDVRSLTLEKLTSLTEDPKRAVHVNQSAEMCCETCGNTPICAQCISRYHKGHVTHKVKDLAKFEGEKMKAMMATLEKCKDKLYELPKRVAKVRNALEENVKEQLEEARIKHEKASEKVLEKTNMEKRVLEGQRKEIIRRNKEECEQVREEMEEKMKELKQKYDKILQGKEQSCRREVEKVDTQTGIIDDMSSAKVSIYNRDLEGYEEKVKASRIDNEERISEVADQVTLTINRYENLTATADIVHASHDEWTEAQCLPDIKVAGEVLIKDAKEEFGDLESRSETGVRESVIFTDQVMITDNHESVVDIQVIGKGWDVHGITSGVDGHIIVTGRARGVKSHITVINREGEVVRHNRIKKVAGSAYPPYRYCHSLSQHLTATVCGSNLVSLYDNRNGGYVSKNIEDMHINWPGCATCVTTDSLNNIYVGGYHREVLVLSEQLNYLRTIKLPEIIKWARDIAVHDDHLIVCDLVSDKSYAVTMQGAEADVVYQLTTPDSGRCPLSVCTDSSQYIYMLWSGKRGKILTQYSQDGHRILTTKKVHENAWCITVAGTKEGEKLLVATSRTMYTFGLL